MDVIEDETDDLRKRAAAGEALIEIDGVPCRFDDPGDAAALIESGATALLRDVPRPDRAQTGAALGGVLCRCTGYQKIVEAVEDAAGRLSKAPKG